jgi:hypothetical protein
MRTHLLRVDGAAEDNPFVALVLVPVDADPPAQNALLPSGSHRLQLFRRVRRQLFRRVRLQLFRRVRTRDDCRWRM